MKNYYFLFFIISCSNVVNSQIPSIGWNINSPLYEQNIDGKSIVSDSIGNIYVAGTLEDTFIIQNDTLIASSGTYSNYLMKVDTTGQVLWTKNIIGNVYWGIFDMVTDRENNLIILGYANSLIINDSIILPSIGNYSRNYIIKFNSNGDFIFIKENKFGGFNCRISVDEQNNIYFLGMGTEDLILSNNDTLNLGTQGELYFIKYNKYGDIIWHYNTTQIGYASGVAYVKAIGTDVLGNIYMLTGVVGSHLFGNDTIGQGTWWLKMDTSGNPIMAKTIIVQNALIDEISVDRIGNMYFTGKTTNSSSTVPPILLGKIDMSGNLLWWKFDGTQVQSYFLEGMGYSIVIDSHGDIWVTGSFGGRGVFGNDTLITPWPDKNVLIVHYNSNGDVLNAFNIPSTTVGFGITEAYDRNIYIKGRDGNEFYLVQLIASIQDSNYCAPIAYFNYSISGQTVSFFDSSQYSTSLEWDFANSSSTEQNPIVFYSVGDTIYYVCLISNNTCGTDTFCDSVQILATEIKNTVSSNNIYILPNPNNGKFLLLSDYLKSAKIQIFNCLGTMIYQSENVNSEIDLSKQAKGIYSIIIRSNENTYIKKLIIQ